MSILTAKTEAQPVDLKTKISQKFRDAVVRKRLHATGKGNRDDE
jgi:hypothetical protein